jgi:hypothetical protein
MPFVWDACQETFPTAAIDRDPDPSLSVARGLASAGRQRVRVARFRDDIRAIGESAEARNYIRVQTEEAFQAIKGTLAGEMRQQKRKAWPDLIANPPDQERIARDLQAAISSYLMTGAQEVCRKYGVDDHRFGVNLKLPPLFAAKIVERISNAANLMRLPGNIAYATLSSIAWRALRRKGLKPDPVSIATIALSVGIDQGRALYLQQRAISQLLTAELPAEKADSLIDEILNAMIGEMDKRANALERFVT